MIDLVVAWYYFTDLCKRLFMDTDTLALMEEMIYLHSEGHEIDEELWEMLYFLLFVRFSEFGPH